MPLGDAKTGTALTGRAVGNAKCSEKTNMLPCSFYYKEKHKAKYSK